MIAIETEFDEINGIIERLLITLKQKNASGDYFVNSLCEDIFIVGLNKIFDADFKNLNITKPNAPAADLIDRKKRIIIQVTSDNKATKLYKTLTKWKENVEYYADCDILYHFVLDEKKMPDQKKVNERLEGSTFIFNIHEHLIDLNGMVSLLRNRLNDGLSPADIVEVKELLEQCIDGVDFKYRHLVETDKAAFKKADYYMSEKQFRLDRVVHNRDTGIHTTIKELFADPAARYVQLVCSAGLGKSFALNVLFEDLFGQTILDTANITPYTLNLKGINPNTSIEEQIIAHFHKRKDPLLILDGLDEIGDDLDQQRIEENLYDYLKRYSHVRCLISGRYELKILGKNEYASVSFTKHELDRLTSEQISGYLRHKKILAEISKDPVFAKIEVALQIPFNLFHVSEYFVKNKRLENSVTLILHKRINEDLAKHSSDKMMVLKARLFLERLSIINNFVENNKFPLREIGKAVEFDSRMFRLISKIDLLHVDDSDETVRFNNNNKFTEDILAAYYFADRDWDTFREFFEVGGQELNIPSTWFNAISMLLVLKGVDSDFSRNIIQNHPYVLVNAEDFGFAIEERIAIFKRIFEDFEQKDLWIDRSVYDEQRLAAFGDTHEGFEYLVNKVRTSTHFRARSQAISLLGNFKPSQGRAKSLYETLIGVITPTNKVGDQISQSYHCLSEYGEFLSEEQKKEIVDRSATSGDEFLRYDRYVRAAVYRFITHCRLQKDYLVYLLEGLQLLDRHSGRPDFGRGDVSLMDEGIYLEHAFYDIEDETALLSAARPLFASFPDYDRYHATNVLEKIIEKLEKAVKQRKNNKRLIKKLVEMLSKFESKKENLSSWYEWQETITNFKLGNFIISVLGAEKEVLQKLFSKNPTFWSNFNFIANVVAELLTMKSLDVVVKALDSGKIKPTDASYLLDLLPDEKKEVREVWQKKLKERGIESSQRIKHPNHEESAQFQKSKFDLLFDAKRFLKDILVFFRKSSTIESEIFEEADWYDEPFFYYSDPRIEFLRNRLDFRFSNTLTRKEVQAYFRKPNITDILISEIHQDLKKHKYTLTEDQASQMKSWLADKVSKVDFRRAIYDVRYPSFRLNELARYVYSWAGKLGFRFDKETNLDLLSYEDIGGMTSETGKRYEEYFDPLVDEINDMKAVKQRVRENLESGIDYFPILNNHILFSVRHNLTENYPLIKDNIQRLLPAVQGTYRHDNPVLAYFRETKDFDYLESMLPKEASDFFWQAIDLMIEDGQYKDRITANLRQRFEMEENPNNKLKLTNKLIENNAAGALELFVETIAQIKEAGDDPDFSFYDFALSKYVQPEIEAAVRLIELSYRFEFERFHNLRGSIFNYFQNLIKADKTQLQPIVKAVQQLMDSRRGQLEGIQFMEHDLKSLKIAYYSFHKSNRTFKEAKAFVDRFD